MPKIPYRRPDCPPRRLWQGTPEQRQLQQDEFERGWDDGYGYVQSQSSRERRAEVLAYELGHCLGLSTRRDRDTRILQRPGAEHPEVYFIQEGAGGNIKIGVTMDAGGWKRRLMLFQTGNSNTLVCLLACPARVEDEKVLHRIFQDHRVRGEWFCPTPPLLDAVAYLCRMRRSRGWLVAQDLYRVIRRLQAGLPAPSDVVLVPLPRPPASFVLPNSRLLLAANPVPGHSAALTVRHSSSTG